MSVNVPAEFPPDTGMAQVNAGNPHFSDITIAPQCNLRCKMCKAWHAPADGPCLTLEECKSFVDSLAEFVTTPLEINVMGGEPLIAPWCLDLCSYIADKGFKSIISTNATLITEDVAKRIADSRLTVLAISLESLTPGPHDFYRGREGVHKQVMQAIEYLDKYCREKLCFTVLTIMMEKNIDELIPLAKWVESHGLFENISYLALLETGLVSQRNNWFKQDVYKDLWPQDKAKFDAVIDELKRLRKNGCKIWNPLSQLDAFKEYYEEPDAFMKNTKYKIHDYIVDVDEQAKIYLSGEELGNLRDTSVKELWLSENARIAREKINTRGPGKRCCVINFVCAFPSDEEYNKNAEDTDPKPTAENQLTLVTDEEQRSIRKPRFSVIEVMRACPMRCEMCFNWKAEKINELISLEDIKKYVSRLADFVEPPFEINLAGGEPLLREDIFEIVEHIRSYDFTVSLTTAGYLLDGDLLNRIVASGVTLLPISLDSLDPEMHDFLRGRPGTFRKVMNAFNYLTKSKGCLRNLTIQTIIMKPNLHEITHIVKWADEREISVSLMAVMRPNGIPIDPHWYTKDEYQFLFPDDLEAVYSVLDEVIELKKAGFRIDNSIEQLQAFKEYYKNPTVFVKKGHCSLGDGIVNVGPDGSVYLCWEKGPLGNIKNDDIHSLWYSERAKYLRGEIETCTRNCSEMVNCFFES